MLEDSILNRANILIQQKRYDDAERLLKELLTADPNDVHVLLLLAEVYLQQDKVAQAEILINIAISISPDYSDLFYTKARIAINKEIYNDAEKFIEQAIKINPIDADYYALWASVKLARKQYQDALDLANTALGYDSENILGLNIRSTALLKLDKKEASFQTIEGALREDPNNAYTHANYGWNLLEKGNHKKALEHFREALKNDPNFEYAKDGMVEALKAKSIFYRLFLKYSFWINNLTAKYQWGVILGFYFGTKLLRVIAKNNPTLEPYLTPIIITLAIIAFSTWIITPISNLFLRLNKYGRHLLDKKKMMSSNFVGISLLVFLAGTIFYLLNVDERYLAIAFFGFAMMVPFSAMFSASRYPLLLAGYTIGMTVIGILAIILVFKSGILINGLSTVFLFGFIAFQWLANFLLIRESNV